MKERLVSLDAFRGITIIGMIIVNTPGSWSYVFPPLRHSEWNGLTPTDLVFPFFSFHRRGFLLCLHSKTRFVLADIKRTNHQDN